MTGFQGPALPGHAMAGPHGRDRDSAGQFSTVVWDKQKVYLPGQFLSQ